MGLQMVCCQCRLKLEKMWVRYKYKTHHHQNLRWLQSYKVQCLKNHRHHRLY